MGKLETIVQGTEHTITLTITDASTGLAIDVRAWDLFFTLKKNYTDTTALISKTEADMTIGGIGYNVIEIPLLYTETNIDPGNVVRDLDYLLIFPNPAKDVVHLRFILNQKALISAEIYDVSGRLISQPYHDWMMPAEHDIAIDISSWEKGMYLVRFSAGSEVVTKEIIVL